ncbi:HD domain-containing phosphohydrolase [Chitinilyticum piscinae]|uniref:HD domain-containing protein n=1 Tax=Chitinilyticum piscinae TaxID=2866724 RepID=A0A8J7FHW8_9NEIS|nr:HD domain-containing phosphohydrolase [Chitinilyticum piscinae]MBE9608520.1 HD domain-containing protein [Chitinilyticum piscinae]
MTLQSSRHNERGNSFSVSLFDMTSALSTALDLLDPALGSHQKRTCLIAAQIARCLNIAGRDYQELFGAAIFHDIGAIGLQQRLAMLEFEEHDAHQHAQLGALLLSRFPGFESYASLVRHHHVQWQHGEGATHEGEAVPLLSHLLYLADRIEILAQQHQDNLLAEIGHIEQQIAGAAGHKFHPLFVEAFLTLSPKESFWLDLFSSNLDRTLMAIAPFENINLDLEHMLRFARFFALVIDSRSHFTATHSAGVACTAEAIAMHLGMSELECTKIRMAGYLHDLGKLAIPSEYIERHGGLEPVERARIRSHSYITYDILGHIRGMEDVAQWAAFHHERLDGSGYPYHLGAADLPLGARIMAVADVYTALSEDRPYRDGMSRETALATLADEVQRGKLDDLVYTTLSRHIEEIEQKRAQAQIEEGLELEHFWQLALHPHSANHPDTAP